MTLKSDNTLGTLVALVSVIKHCPTLFILIKSKMYPTLLSSNLSKISSRSSTGLTFSLPYKLVFSQFKCNQICFLLTLRSKFLMGWPSIEKPNLPCEYLQKCILIFHLLIYLTEIIHLMYGHLNQCRTTNQHALNLMKYLCKIG